MSGRPIEDESFKATSPTLILIKEICAAFYLVQRNQILDHVSQTDLIGESNMNKAVIRRAFL